METNINQNNMENNTLSIIDSPLSKDKIIINDKVNNNENIPIKQLTIINFKTPEEYYSQNYPEFKLFKINGFLFCKIGNLISFNFDKNNNFTPKLSIGPNWYMTLFLNILITVLGSTMYICIIKRIHFLYRIGMIIICFILIILVNRAALIHPEIVLNKEPDSHNCSFCNICKVYYNPGDKVEHCSLCKVCIKKCDHHCVWIGKCVGKNNFRAFIEMILGVLMTYIYLIICILIFVFKK